MLIEKACDFVRTQSLNASMINGYNKNKDLSLD